MQTAFNVGVTYVSIFGGGQRIAESAIQLYRNVTYFKSLWITFSGYALQIFCGDVYTIQPTCTTLFVCVSQRRGKLSESSQPIVADTEKEAAWHSVSIS